VNSLLVLIGDASAAAVRLGIGFGGAGVRQRFQPGSQAVRVFLFSLLLFPLSLFH